MSADHPVLIFVAGPQAGQRVLLNRSLLVLGRGGGSDVMLSEDFVSRRQGRYELIEQGPTLENLSARGTWINGKRYKRGKRLLLETGDLIGVGKDTEMLFVAAGDDPDSALAMYEAAVPASRNAFGKRPRPEVPAEDLERPEAEGETPPLEPAAETPERKKRGRRRPSEITAGERVAAEEQARRRKIFLALGIYFGVIVLCAIILWVYLGTEGPAEVRMPRMLKPREIEDALAKIPRKTPNRLLMEERLEHAMGLYQQYGVESVFLFRCVRAFKEALAYSGGHYFEKPHDERIYRRCLKRLTEKITSKYKNAYLFEKEQDWAKAEPAFRELMGILSDDPEFEKNRLFTNVRAHHKRVQHYLRKKKPARRTPWM